MGDTDDIEIIPGIVNSISSDIDIDSSADSNAIYDRNFKVSDTNLEKQEKIKTEISKVAPTIYHLIPQCNSEHLLYCDCQKELFNKLRMDEKMRIYDKLKDSGMLTEDPAMSRHRLAEADAKAFELLVEYCEKNDVRCAYHTEQLQNIYDLFRNKYDMTEPKVTIAMTVLMSQLSSLIKSQAFSNKRGIIESATDKNGNEHLNTFMNEKLKIDIGNSIMKAVKTLDETVEGSKNVNLNINAGEIRSIRDIFGDK